MPITHWSAAAAVTRWIFAALEALAQRVDVKLMILCSPHNPVGRAWTRGELERVGRICIDNGVMIAVDEIHADLTLPPHSTCHLPQYRTSLPGTV